MDEFFKSSSTYEYKGFGNCKSVCGLTIFTKDDRAVVIMSELPTNTGTSVTNIVEQLATKIYHERLSDFSRDNITWVEHYIREDGSDDTFDRVIMRWDGKQFFSPQWYPISDLFDSSLVAKRLFALPPAPVLS